MSNGGWQPKLGFACCLVSIFCQAERIPLVFDHDGNYDDLLGLAFLAQHPLFEIKAITLAAAGLATPHGGPPNTLAVADLLGLNGVPVAYGHPQSLSPVMTFPLQWRIELENFMNRMFIETAPDGRPILQESPTQTSKLLAPDLILQVLQESSKPVVVLCTGPLTNLAVALMADPTVVPRIAALFVMGSSYGTGVNSIGAWATTFNGIYGACTEDGGQSAGLDAKPLNVTSLGFTGPGQDGRGAAAVRPLCRGVNMTQQGGTDWNLFVDALAWHQVLRALEGSAVRLYAYTNNVTANMPVTQAGMLAQTTQMAPSRLRAFMEHLAEAYANTSGAEWWDAVAAVSMADVISGEDSTGNGVCAKWLRGQRIRVLLSWRDDPARGNPYGRVVNGSELSPAGDFCLMGHPQRMWNVYWPNLRALAARAAVPAASTPLDSAWYLRELPPWGSSQECIRAESQARLALILASVAICAALLPAAVGLFFLIQMIRRRRFYAKQVDGSSSGSDTGIQMSPTSLDGLVD